MALCENEEPESLGGFEVWDRDGLVVAYPRATLRVVSERTHVRVEVGNSDGPIMMRGDANQAREALDMASRERDKLKVEIANLKERNDWQKSKIGRLYDELNEVRGELQAKMASLDFSVENGKRLIAELDEVRKMKDNSPCMQRALDAEAKLAEVREAHSTTVAIAGAENKRLMAERDEARRDFLKATESHKWKYAAHLEARLEAVVAALEEAMASGNWVHVNQTLKIAKGQP